MPDATTGPGELAEVIDCANPDATAASISASWQVLLQELSTRRCRTHVFVKQKYRMGLTLAQRSVPMNGAESPSKVSNDCVRLLGGQGPPGQSRCFRCDDGMELLQIS